MTRFQVTLHDDEARAFDTLCMTKRRMRGDLAALIIRSYLVKRGLLNDPTGGGRTAGRVEKQAGSAERLADGRAASV